MPRFGPDKEPKIYFTIAFEGYHPRKTGRLVTRPEAAARAFGPGKAGEACLTSRPVFRG